MNFLTPATQHVGKQFFHYARCDSTNRVAQQLIQTNQVSDGAIVHADEQSAGRGQQHHRWESVSAQNLTFSVVFFPELPIEQQHYLTVVASLSVYDTLADVLHQPVHIKWPNDILCESSKICGILIQNNLKGRKIHSTVIGIGLNINQDQFAAPRATSLALLTGHYWDRTQVLMKLAQALEVRFQQLRQSDWSALRHEYLENMFWKDERHLFQRSARHVLRHYRRSRFFRTIGRQRRRHGSAVRHPGAGIQVLTVNESIGEGP